LSWSNYNIRNNDGFTLLEILAALSVLAVSMGVLMHIFSTSLQNSVASRQYTQAVLLAESMLAEKELSPTAESQTLSGQLNDLYHWRYITSPYNPDNIQQATSSPLVPYLADIEISWEAGGKQHSVTLSTLRLALRKN
jgi:general secretion pathway protein I